MDRKHLLQRITCNPGIFGGKPIVRGLRISVESIIGLLARGVEVREILEDHPALERDDILACLAYAHAAIANDSLGDIKVG
ncbi:MAG: DUF433 domain-containing protein [Planctomycetes bacterium]|nr:DUF433 domain-containing protein [Planctomycetota bacterium]